MRARSTEEAIASSASSARKRSNSALSLQRFALGPQATFLQLDKLLSLPQRSAFLAQPFFGALRAAIIGRRRSRYRSH
jgi:hypothetical protein